MQAFQLIMNFLVMPIFFLSGSLFPIDGSSGIFKYILMVNPLAYGVDGLRGSLTGGFYFGMGIDLIVLLTITTVILHISSYFFSRMEA